MKSSFKFASFIAAIGCSMLSATAATFYWDAGTVTVNGASEGGTGAWTVGADSDRVGLRLHGDPLARRRTEELPSEGMVLGAVQVPPDGQPVVFLADHPPTGGYPVVAVVEEADLWRCAQLRPGERVRFTRAR